MAEQTVRVRRGGSYLTIPVTCIDRYMAKGYDVVDDYGNVTKACVPHDIGALQKAFVEKSAEIERLTKEVKNYKTQVEKLLAALNDSTAAKEVNETPAEVVEDKPVKKSKKK